jgi:LemA protein
VPLAAEGSALGGQKRPLLRHFFPGKLGCGCQIAPKQDKNSETWPLPEYMNRNVAIGCGCLAVLILVVVAIAAVVGGGGYNRLVQSQASVDTSWANVQTQYQRRADLIPNLVNTVQGAANFEKSTLTDVINARANATKVTVDMSKAPTDPEAIKRFQQAQDGLSSTLGRLLAVSENYPELKANTNFRDLQAQLEGTENRIAVARGDFNKAAQAYNVMVKSFPTVLYAGLMGFSPKAYFASAAGAENAPTVSFPSFSPSPSPK